MKYCIHCGAQLEDNDKFCTSCGQVPDSTEVNTAPSNTAYTPNPEPVKPETSAYCNDAYEAQPVSKGKCITGLVLGACGLSFSWLGILSFFGLIAVGLSIAGLIVAAPAKKAGSKMGRIGWILALIGLILSALLTIIYTILWATILSY